LGGGGFSQPFRMQLKELICWNIIYCSKIGTNNDANPSYPAVSYPNANIIAVAASITSTGALVFLNTELSVDIGSSRFRIWSTVLDLRAILFSYCH
jgi:hypothetical protein